MTVVKNEHIVQYYHVDEANQFRIKSVIDHTVPVQTDSRTIVLSFGRRQKKRDS
jgi:hypothetical protein